MCSLFSFLDTSLTIEEVDRRIQSLHNDIRTLETYRNARFSIISKLPQETLSIIFEYLVLPPDARYNQRPDLLWLSASQVCTLWRKVALDSPRIWGRIYGDMNENLVDLLLERAKSDPLYLLSRGLDSREATVRRILECFSRLKEIELTCSAGEFQSIAEMKTSVLESMSLGYIFMETLKARFSPRVEPGTTPLLRYISLRNCIFDLDVPFFSHLRTLKMDCVRLMNGPTLSISHILTALGNMEYLERLELVNVVGESDEIPENLIVHLPRLTHIVMEVGGVRGLLLFTHLSCPNIQSIIATARGNVEPNSLALVTSTIYAMIPTFPNAWEVRAHSSPHDAEIYIWPDPSSDDTKAPFRICISFPLMLLPLLPAETSAVLDFVSGHCRADTNALEGFLRSLKTVEEVHVHCVEDLLLLLSVIPTNSNGEQCFSLPSLRRIVLIEEGQLEEKQHKLKKLGQLLAARSSMDAGIGTFRIRCPSNLIPEHEVKHLELLVGTLNLEHQ